MVECLNQDKAMSDQQFDRETRNWLKGRLDLSELHRREGMKQDGEISLPELILLAIATGMIIALLLSLRLP